VLESRTVALRGSGEWRYFEIKVPGECCIVGIRETVRRKWEQFLVEGFDSLY